MRTTNTYPAKPNKGVSMKTNTYPLTSREHRLIHQFRKHAESVLRMFIDNPDAVGRSYGSIFNEIVVQLIRIFKPRFKNEERFVKAINEFVTLRWVDLKSVCDEVEFFVDRHYHSLIPTPSADERVQLIEKYRLFNTAPCA